jgi:hypothetical protein
LPGNDALELPFRLETRLERTITADPKWVEGALWGVSRPGHPEGKVIFHIRDVLNNIEQFFGNSDDRPGLRLIALIHDTFKYQAARSTSGSPGKSHGYWARRFAERYINDPGILQVIELHDEAYKAFVSMSRYTDREAAEKSAEDLIAQLGDNIELFLRFYLCDSRTGDKSMSHYEWFKELVEARCKSSFKEDLDEQAYV